MNSRKIEFIENKPVKLQINNVKQILIESNVILGKKFTLEIATLIIQIEKLMNYYDTKKIPSRFKANFQSLELNLSSEEILSKNISKFTNELNLIKTMFNDSKENEQKRNVMFKLLFFHINILFNTYQELNLNNFVVNKSYERPKLEKSSLNENLEKLTDKQLEKYLKLTHELENAEPTQKNKIRAGLTYYKNIMKK